MAEPKCQHKVLGVGKRHGAQQSSAQPRVPWIHRVPLLLIFPHLELASSQWELPSHHPGGTGGCSCHQPGVTARQDRATLQQESLERGAGEPDRAAPGAPTPCVTPREDLLIPGRGLEEGRRHRVLCDAHVPDPSAPAGVTGAVCGQRAVSVRSVCGQCVLGPCTALDTCPRRDKDSRDKDTDVPVPGAVLQLPGPSVGL